MAEAEATDVIVATGSGEGEGEPGAAPEPGSSDVKEVAAVVTEPGEEPIVVEGTVDPDRKPIALPVPDPRIVNLPDVVTGAPKINGHKLQRDIKIESRPSDFDENPPAKVVDLCCIMDCTGSMSAWIKHCKDTLHDVIDDSMEEDEGSAVRVSFVGYRDFCDKFLYDICDFTYLDDDMKKFISKRKAKGGGDAPEDIQGALHQALNLSWREDSIKVCFLVADAPCHGKKYHRQNDDYPKGNPHGLILEDLVKEFSDREIALTCYKLTNDTEQMFDIMEKAYETGKEKDGFEFIDIRGQVQGHKALLHRAPAAPARASYTLSLEESDELSCEMEMLDAAPVMRSCAMPERSARSAAPRKRSKKKMASRPILSAPMSKSMMKSPEMRDAYGAATKSNLRKQKAKFKARKGW